MPSCGPVTRDLLETFGDVRSRTFARLDGITDAEYLWEPVPACMTVRPAGNGTYLADSRSAPSGRPARFTTIAWRMWHIGADCLRGYLRLFEDASQDTGRHLWPGTAAGATEMLAHDWSRFQSHIESLGDDRLLRPMGHRAGKFGHESYLLLALHALDEAAHHGAEIGVLRDLYLHSFSTGPGDSVLTAMARAGTPRLANATAKLPGLGWPPGDEHGTLRATDTHPGPRGGFATAGCAVSSPQYLTRGSLLSAAWPSSRQPYGSWNPAARA